METVQLFVTYLGPRDKKSANLQRGTWNELYAKVNLSYFSEILGPRGWILFRFQEHWLDAISENVNHPSEVE